LLEYIIDALFGIVHIGLAILAARPWTSGLTAVVIQLGFCLLLALNLMGVAIVWLPHRFGVGLLAWLLKCDLLGSDLHGSWPASYRDRRDGNSISVRIRNFLFLMAQTACNL